MRVAIPINLTEQERKDLEKLSRGGQCSVRARERSLMVLLAAEGWENKTIAQRLGTDSAKVARWRKRYATLRLAGILKDKTRPGGFISVPQRTRARVVRLTLHSKPPGATVWSRESMAREVGVSPSSVGRIWAAHGLKPHRIKTFKLSNDRCFAEKLEDIVGLYLSPPEHAIVLCCDEKSQIQALDRTQPGLPIKKGRCQTMTHDYKRNGTTSLFAALNTADGRVIGTCMNKHRHQEWLRFLNLLRRSTPKDKEIHVICDNYATHKHDKVTAWQKRNPRFHFHFTPTSASWLNMVERFFRDLTVRSLRRGVFRSIEELTAAIYAHIDAHNAQPKPFVWTATASDILEKVKRGRRKLDTIQSI
jgi:transposase